MPIPIAIPMCIPENADQPKPSGSIRPDEKGITHFQKADQNSS